MHDRYRSPLKVGDLVLIPARVADISDSTAEYCNVTFESHFGRRPDGNLETMSALNSAICIKMDGAGPDTEVLVSKDNTEDLSVQFTLGEPVNPPPEPYKE